MKESSLNVGASSVNIPFTPTLGIKLILPMLLVPFRSTSTDLIPQPYLHLIAGRSATLIIPRDRNQLEPATATVFPALAIV